jgi:hypothetical protein
MSGPKVRKFYAARHVVSDRAGAQSHPSFLQQRLRDLSTAACAAGKCGGKSSD